MASDSIQRSSLHPDIAGSPQRPHRIEPPENGIARLPHPRQPLLKKVKGKTREVLKPCKVNGKFYMI
jgi:hypothetical protein